MLISVPESVWRKTEVSETNRTEFTSTEEKIIEVVNEGIAKVLEQSWKDLTPITIKFHSREQTHNLQHL